MTSVNKKKTRIDKHTCDFLPFSWWIVRLEGVRVGMGEHMVPIFSLLFELLKSFHTLTIKCKVNWLSGTSLPRLGLGLPLPLSLSLSICLSLHAWNEFINSQQPGYVFSTFPGHQLYYHDDNTIINPGSHRVQYPLSYYQESLGNKLTILQFHMKFSFNWHFQQETLRICGCSLEVASSCSSSQDEMLMYTLFVLHFLLHGRLKPSPRSKMRYPEGPACWRADKRAV